MQVSLRWRSFPEISKNPDIIDVACYYVLSLNLSNYYTFLVYNYVLFCKIKTEAYFG